MSNEEKSNALFLLILGAAIRAPKDPTKASEKFVSLSGTVVVDGVERSVSLGLNPNGTHTLEQLQKLGETMAKKRLVVPILDARYEVKTDANGAVIMSTSAKTGQRTECGRLRPVVHGAAVTPVWAEAFVAPVTGTSLEGIEAIAALK